MYFVLLSSASFGVGQVCYEACVRVARQTERDVMGERQIQERRGEERIFIHMGML